MKKQTLLFTAVLLLSTTVTFSQNFNFGVRGGLNVAKLSMNLRENLWPQGNKIESRTSFNLGGFGQYSINEKITLQAELFYSGEGTRFSKPGTENPAELNLSYLALPVFFKYTVAKGFYVMAGPQFSYLLKAESVFENGNEYDITEATNRLGVGLVPALGYDWKDISLSVRYAIGLSKLPNTSAPGMMGVPYPDEDVKSNVFEVVLAYKIIK